MPCASATPRRRGTGLIPHEADYVRMVGMPGAMQPDFVATGRGGHQCCPMVASIQAPREPPILECRRQRMIEAFTHDDS